MWEKGWEEMRANENHLYLRGLLFPRQLWRDSFASKRLTHMPALTAHGSKGQLLILIIFLDPSDASTSYPFMHEHLFECKCLYMTATAQLQGKVTSVSTVV